MPLKNRPTNAEARIALLKAATEELTRVQGLVAKALKDTAQEEYLSLFLTRQITNVREDLLIVMSNAADDDQVLNDEDTAYDNDWWEDFGYQTCDREFLEDEEMVDEVRGWFTEPEDDEDEDWLD